MVTLEAGRAPILCSEARVGIKQFTMSVHHPEIDQFISGRVLLSGAYEGEKSLDMVNQMKAAPTGAVFLDVGANIGMHTLGVAAHGFSTVSIEALGTNFEKLEQSVVANGFEHSTLHHAAVTDNKAITAVCMEQKSTNQGGTTVSHTQDCAPGMMAKASTLDDLVGDLVVHVMKVDVERHELMVLRSAPKLLAPPNQPKAIYIEIGTSQIEHGAVSVIALLFEYGYGCRLDLSTGRSISMIDMATALEARGPSGLLLPGGLLFCDKSLTADLLSAEDASTRRSSSGSESSPSPTPTPMLISMSILKRSGSRSNGE